MTKRDNETREDALDPTIATTDASSAEARAADANAALDALYAEPAQKVVSDQGVDSAQDTVPAEAAPASQDAPADAPSEEVPERAADGFSFEGAHAAAEGEEPSSGFGDRYQDYYNQSYDDAKAGPDAFASLEPMKTTSFRPVGAQKRSGRASHAKPAPQLTERQRKSRRMRRVLIAAIVVIVALMAVLAVLMFQFVQTTHNAVTQQAQQEGSQTVESAETPGDTTDADSVAVRTTEVPTLTTVMGLTQDEAVAQIGHGAVVSGVVEVNEEGNPIRQRATIVLTEEPADALSGTPTVYLGLNAEGRVVMAGYSAATASLGYGNVSFVDAVRNENIVEKTLDEAGLSVPAGSAVLPDDRSAYCTYASDGTTLVEENYTFNGEGDVNGMHCTWSSMLMYNYTAANASGNLADTIRQIYVYINAA